MLEAVNPYLLGIIGFILLLIGIYLGGHKFIIQFLGAIFLVVGIFLIILALIGLF